MLNCLNLYFITIIYILVDVLMCVNQNETAYMIGAHKFHLSFFKLNVEFDCNFLQL